MRIIKEYLVRVIGKANKHQYWPRCLFLGIINAMNIPDVLDRLDDIYEQRGINQDLVEDVEIIENEKGN